MVVKVSDGSNIPVPGGRTAKCKEGEAVLIRWDANKDLGCKSTLEPQQLMKSKWNPKVHKAGGWRFYRKEKH